MLEWRVITVCGCAIVALLAAWPSGAFQSRLEDRTHSKTEAQANASKPVKPGKRTVWNLDGGVFFATDGHLQNGSCFRLQGQMVAPEFFDGLRRVDTEEGTSYLLHDKVVTEYPDQVEIVLHLLDYPCSTDLKETAVRPPLTREMMSTLHLNFFWKAGVHMHPVEDSRRIGAEVRQLAPYARSAAAQGELAPRYEWNYSFTVNCQNVPLTEDLVLIIENAEHKIAARVAARL